MKTKKTVTPFNMQEIARALREMISEDSPNASEALLSGTREAVFREIFIFHYPSFLEKLYQSIPEVDIRSPPPLRRRIISPYSASR